MGLLIPVKTVNEAIMQSAMLKHYLETSLFADEFKLEYAKQWLRGELVVFKMVRDGFMSGDNTIKDSKPQVGRETFSAFSQRTKGP